MSSRTTGFFERVLNKLPKRSPLRPLIKTMVIFEQAMNESFGETEEEKLAKAQRRAEFEKRRSEFKKRWDQINQKLQR
ncbi:MAG: hypothetical protein AAF267_17655 [Deinococcota bacterium]